jgi:hypothetical protein
VLLKNHELTNLLRVVGCAGMALLVVNIDTTQIDMLRRSNSAVLDQQEKSTLLLMQMLSSGALWFDGCLCRLHTSGK